MTNQLLESPIPTTTTPATTTSQKASSGDILGTKRGIIDPLVRCQNNRKKVLNKKIQKKNNKGLIFKKCPIKKYCIFFIIPHIHSNGPFLKNGPIFTGPDSKRPEVPA